ncbi:MAG: carboxypeptidase regulatory-like domain-containing protein [Planctomycetes bacterium]|nr:carboxypeptidase regulatory-like domain-containing protein [Planctomycetota bacterium]
MRHRRLFLFAIYTALSLALFLWWDSGREIERGEPVFPAEELMLPPSPEEAQAPAESARLSEPERSERRDARVDEAFGPPLPTAIPEGSFGPPTPLASISGRCVDSAGSPVEGAVITLGAEAFGGRRFEELHEQSARDGRFRVELEPQKLAAIHLALRGPSGESQVFRWDHLQGGRAIDLGDVRLGGRATLRFRIVGEDGAPSPARWILELRSNAFGLEHGADLRAVEYLRSEPFADGEIGGLPAGEATVSLRHAALLFLEQKRLDLREGASNEIELRSPARGLDGWLKLSIGYPHAPHQVQGRESAVWLEAPGGQRIEPQRGPRRAYEFRELAPVPHTLHIEHPSYPSFAQPEVFPGQQLRVELRGTSVLVLDVRDAASGAPVTSYVLELRYASPEHAGRSAVRRAEPTALAPADGRFDGIVPGDILAVVSSPEHEPLAIDLGPIAPREERRVAFSLTRGARIFGRVRDIGGLPASGCKLIAGPRLEGELDARRLLDERLLSPTSLQHREARSDEEGRFELAHLSSGPHWVVAFSPEELIVEQSCVLLPGQELELELALPGAARLRGRLMGDVELPFDVLLRFVDLSLPADHPRALGDAPSARLDSERRFELYPLAAGSHRVELHLPTGYGPGGSPVVTERVSLELGRIELAAGTTLEQDFDLGRLKFAKLELELAIEGLADVEGSAGLRRIDLPGIHPTIQAEIEGARVARFPLVPPGRYELVLQLQSLHMSYVHATPIELARGEAQRVRIESRATRRKIRVVDASSKLPLAGQGVDLAGAGGINMTLITDERGELELLLLPGRYILRMPALPGAAKQPRRAELHWGENGPFLPELAF